jgi:hypothetical protein
MHFHLPKPLHGWRAFVGEVGIIVLGVLIALAAEQVVENIHDRYLAREALEHIRGELSFDSAFAAERVAIGDCMRSSFTDLRQRLIASGDDWPGLDGKPLSGAAKTPSPFFATPPPISSPRHIWPVSAWAAATSSGVFNHGQKRFFNYAALYAMVDWLDRIQDREVADESKLMPFDAAQRLDPSARLELLRDLGAVDADNADAERLSAEFVRAAGSNGIPPDPVWLQRGLRQASGSRGACVKQGRALDAAVDREFNAGACGFNFSHGRACRPPR